MAISPGRMQDERFKLRVAGLQIDLILLPAEKLTY